MPEIGPPANVLTQLIGLTEEEARSWADASGFTVVRRSDDERTPANVNPLRLNLTVSPAGRVTAAHVG